MSKYKINLCFLVTNMKKPIKIK